MKARGSNQKMKDRRKEERKPSAFHFSRIKMRAQRSVGCKLLAPPIYDIKTDEKLEFFHMQEFLQHFCEFIDIPIDMVELSPDRPRFFKLHTVKVANAFPLTHHARTHRAPPIQARPATAAIPQYHREVMSTSAR